MYFFFDDQSILFHFYSVFRLESKLWIASTNFGMVSLSVSFSRSHQFQKSTKNFVFFKNFFFRWAFGPKVHNPNDPADLHRQFLLFINIESPQKKSKWNFASRMVVWSGMLSFAHITIAHWAFFTWKHSLLNRYFELEWYEIHVFLSK